MLIPSKPAHGYALFCIKQLFIERHDWTPKQIRDRLGYSRTTIHRYLNTLVEKHLIIGYRNGPFAVYCRLPLKQVYADTFQQVNDCDFGGGF